MKKIIEKIIPKLKFKFPYTIEDYSENLYCENYHKHSFFSNTSVADSPESMKTYAQQTIEYKGKCLFSGEHGNQGNQFEVYKLAEEYNLKYRHSVEAYWVKDRLKEYPEIDKETGEYKIDTKTGEIVLGTFQKLNKEHGRTVILITHEHEVAEYAERIITIRDGLVVSDSKSHSRKHSYVNN